MSDPEEPDTSSQEPEPTRDPDMLFSRKEIWGYDPWPEDEQADREADRLDDLHFNREGL